MKLQSFHNIDCVAASPARPAIDKIGLVLIQSIEFLNKVSVVIINVDSAPDMPAHKLFRRPDVDEDKIRIRSVVHNHDVCIPGEDGGKGLRGFSRYGVPGHAERTGKNRAEGLE